MTTETFSQATGLDRPAGSPMRMPTHTAGLPPATPLKGRGIKPLLSLRKHKFLALAILVLMALVAVPGALILGKHRYYTEAAIHVSPRFVKTLNADQELELQSNTQYREYVQQQVRTINRYDIVLDALKKLGDAQNYWRRPGETERAAAERLAGNLSIKPVPDTYLITVGLEDDKKEGLAEIVNAVMESYIEKQKKEEFFESDKRIESLTEERAKILQETKQKTDRKLAIAQELGVTTFNDAIPNPYDQLLVKAKEAMENARRARIDADAQILALSQPQAGGRTSVDAFAEEIVDKDTGLNGLKVNINQRRSALLTKLSGLTPEHPGRKAIEQELADLDAEVKRATDILIAKARTMLTDQKKSSAYQAAKTERDLALEVDAEATKAQWYAALYSEAMMLGAEIDHARKRIDAVGDRIDYLALETNAPGFVRIATAAREPLAPSRSGHKRSYAMIFLFGVILSLVIPVGVDLLDPRIHVPGELEKTLGFAPVGMIMEKTNEETTHFSTDQLIRLATSLERESRQQGSRTFVLTSAKSAEGTTTATLDLAQTLSELGVSVVAVEANRYRSDERYQDGLSRPGLVDLIDGRASIEDVICPADLLLPDRIAVGDLKGRDLLGPIDGLKSVFSELARNYSMVLIDAAPVLISAETELLVGLADATLLIVQAVGLTKGEIKRAGRTLERLAPPVVGSILTRAQVFKGGGYLKSFLRERESRGRLNVSTILSPWLWR